MSQSPTEGSTVRSACGMARVTYSPRFAWQPVDFITAQPWLTFREGTAGRSFPCLSSAVEYLRSKGYKFPNY